LLQDGAIVAGYRIDGVLGDGGQGTVFRATQLSLNRVVALKLLAPAFSEDPGFRARFEREGKLQAALDHDHIVPVYEAGPSDSGLFLAMRLIDGPTLKQLIFAGELDPRRSVRLLTQVAHALDAAHETGLIHRDVKPQNILIDKGDHAYLADFGLIKAPDEARLTGTGQFIGTIDYVAPEQIQGEPATPASDIYGLTGVLYECLTGDVPFPRASEAATLHAHVVQPPPRVSERRPDLPAALDDVIAHGMAKDSGERPPLASELIQAASRVLSSAAAVSSPAPGSRRDGGAHRDRGQITRVSQATGAAAGRGASAPEPAPAIESPPVRQTDLPGEGVPGAVLTEESLARPPVVDRGPARQGLEFAGRRYVAVVAVLILLAFGIGFLVGDLVH
jgi:serine/threonine protein kinase